jgi:hypothetical protein
MPHRILPLLTALLALAACSREASLPASLEPAYFRSLHPLDETQAGEVLGEYDRVQAVLLERSEHGARATVSLLTADGRVHSGYDEFYSADPVRTREVRDNYSALQIGTQSCILAPTPQPCQTTAALHLGLPPVNKDLLTHAVARDVSCGAGAVPCRLIRVVLGGIEIAPDSRARFGDPEFVGHEYDVLFTLPDHVPLYYKQTDRFSVGSSATAFYVFQFDQPVGPVELPPQAQAAAAQE